MPRLTMMTSMVSEESLAMDMTHTLLPRLFNLTACPLIGITLLEEKIQHPGRELNPHPPALVHGDKLKWCQNVHLFV